MGNINEVVVPEFAQVSIVRYNHLIEHKHQLEIQKLELEMEKRELEKYIERLERMIMSHYKEDKYYVTIDREEVEEVMQLEKVGGEE